MNYNHLYYFHTVARLGSQAAAARELGLRQSTISEQVRQVEALLGRKLFDRTNTGLRLTDEGRRCFEFTETMFNAADRLLEAFDRETTPRTVVEVGITSTVSRSFAADFLLPLFDDGSLMPRIRNGTTSELMQKLGAGESPRRRRCAPSIGGAGRGRGSTRMGNRVCTRRLGPRGPGSRPEDRGIARAGA